MTTNGNTELRGGGWRQQEYIENEILINIDIEGVLAVQIPIGMQHRVYNTHTNKMHGSNSQKTGAGKCK